MQWPEVSANPVARYHVIVFQNMLNEKTEARYPFEILLINQSLMIGLYFAIPSFQNGSKHSNKIFTNRICNYRLPITNNYSLHSNTDDTL